MNPPVSLSLLKLANPKLRREIKKTAPTQATLMEEIIFVEAPLLQVILFRIKLTKLNQYRDQRKCG